MTTPTSINPTSSITDTVQHLADTITHNPDLSLRGILFLLEEVTPPEAHTAENERYRVLCNYVETLKAYLGSEHRAPTTSHIGKQLYTIADNKKNQ